MSVDHKCTNRTGDWCTPSHIEAIALRQAEAGRAVFPLEGKKPLTRNGYRDASRDPEKIRAMFARAGSKATGYGIATGRASGVVVVDVDGPRGRAEAERLGLASGCVVKTGRAEGNGWHVYCRPAPGEEKVKSRTVAPGLEVKGEGAYVVGPGSVHPSSGAPYKLVKDGEPSPAPEWVALPEPKRGERRGQREPVAIDAAGQTIPEGERNRELTSIAGRLHDGTRALEDLARDLESVNAARCSPPLPGRDVLKIARSVYRYEPCSPGGGVTDKVLETVARLEAAAREYPVRGKAGATDWSLYRAGLTMVRRHGREHPEGVALSVDVRTWALEAGVDAGTVSRFVRRSPLVRRIQRGAGRRSAVYLFESPESREGYRPQHSNHRESSRDKKPGCSVAVGTVGRTLYRLRWSERSTKPRRGTVEGTRRVRQSRTPGRDGIGRIGKSRAAIVYALLEAGGETTLGDLANRLGRTPNALKAPLRWLVETGLLIRPSRGRYAVEELSDLSDRLEDARELGAEPEADRLQMERHNRQRAAYRTRHKPDSPDPVSAHNEPPADPTPPPISALAETVREYLERNPRTVSEHGLTELPGWLAGTLWAYDIVDGKPEASDVRAAISELGGVAYLTTVSRLVGAA